MNGERTRLNALALAAFCDEFLRERVALSVRDHPANGEAANRPLQRRAGRAMYGCVALFGVATIAFGLSRSFVISLVALVISGAADLVSVFVRQSLVQLRTPDEMRGRVAAVNLVFVGASNEFGEFESGLTATWLGVVPAEVAGGVGTLVIVGLWLFLFPALRDIDRLDTHPA